MARSWRSFFRKSKDEEPEKGQAVATEIPLQATEDTEADSPSAEEVLAGPKEPAATSVAQVKETGPRELEAPPPEPSEIEEAPRARERGRARVTRVVRAVAAGNVEEPGVVRGSAQRGGC